MNNTVTMMSAWLEDKIDEINDSYPSGNIYTIGVHNAYILALEQLKTYSVMNGDEVS